MLYSIRDVTATVESIPLITASILSKKLAAGLGALILDVKTGSGAFMPTLEKSRALAESLVSVANGAGLKTAALITDMNEPLASRRRQRARSPQCRRFPHRQAPGPAPARGHAGALRRSARTHRPLPMRAAAVDAAPSIPARPPSTFRQMVALLGGPADFVERMDTPSRARADRPRHLRRTAPAPSPPSIRAASAWPWSRSAAGGACRPTASILPSVSTNCLASAHKVDGQTPFARVHARDEATAADVPNALLAAYTISGDSAPLIPLIADRSSEPHDAPRHPLHPRQRSASAARPTPPTTATPAPTRSATSPPTTRYRCPISTRSASAPRPKLSTGTHPARPDRPAQGRPLGRRPRGLARARTRRPATGKSPACPVPFDWGYFPQTEPTFPPDLIAATD